MPCRDVFSTGTNNTGRAMRYASMCQYSYELCTQYDMHTHIVHSTWTTVDYVVVVLQYSGVCSATTGS